MVKRFLSRSLLLGKGDEQILEQTPEEIRAMWRLRWLGTLQYFGDENTQRARWLDREERNPHYSFVECNACYFDDAFFVGHEIDRWVGLGYMTETEYLIMAPFHDLASSYCPPKEDAHDHDAIVADTAWQEVVRAAQLARTQLAELISDPMELAALSNPLQWAEWEPGCFRSVGASGTFTIVVPQGNA